MKFLVSYLMRVFLVLLCGAGAWISGELVKVHSGPWPTSAGHAPASTICGDHSGGCGQVMDSRWSAVDFRWPVPTRSMSVRWVWVVVPVAFMGLSYFVCLGCWFALAGGPARWGRWAIVPLSTVIAGGASSLVLIAVMFVESKSVCPWCMVTHAINAGVIGATLWWCRREGGLRWMWTRAANRGLGESALSFKTGALVMGIAGGMVVGLWEHRATKLETRAAVAGMLPYQIFVENLEKDPEFLLREFLAVEPVGRDCSNPSDLVTFGAPAVVDIFTDFECPHCACFATQWKSRYRYHWQGPLEVRVHHFPLHSSCNDQVSTTIHDQACQASYAAEAARLQAGEEAFWQMHDLLFANSRNLQATSYADLAVEAGLDPDQLIADMADERVVAAVERDVALAGEMAVHGTPSVFLNGRRVPKLCLNNPLFWEVISLKLSEPEFMTARATPGEHDCPKGQACCRKLASNDKAKP